MTGIALSAVLRSFKKWHYLSPVVLCIAVGIGFGAINICQRLEGRFAAGLAFNSIDWVEGYLLEDGASLQGGRSRCIMYARICGTNLGASATARGRLVIIMTGPAVHLTGEIIRVPVTGIKGDEIGGWVAFQNASVSGAGWRREIHRLRGKLLLSLSERVRKYAGEESEFFSALLLGIRDDPADPLINMFRKVGVSHVLALSGMHLAIVASLLLFCARPLIGLRRAYLLSLPLLACYIFLVGIRPSLLRAGIMYLLWTALGLGGRETENVRVVAVDSVGGLAVLPIALSSVSFLLSSVAVLGIM